MPRADFVFEHAFRVRWSETDAQGIVFNSRYLEYGDIAVTEYWREIARRGFRVEDLQCHVKKAEIDFVKPLQPDEMIAVMCRTPHIGNSSMTSIVEIHGNNEAGEDDLRAVISYVVVHVDLATHRPKPIPDWARQTLAAFDAGIPVAATEAGA